MSLNSSFICPCTGHAKLTDGILIWEPAPDALCNFEYQRSAEGTFMGNWKLGGGKRTIKQTVLVLKLAGASGLWGLEHWAGNKSTCHILHEKGLGHS